MKDYKAKEGDMDLVATRSLVEQKNLIPIVPITGYVNKPYCSWGNEKYWIKSPDEIKDDTFSWENSKGESKKGTITGFALLTGVRSNITVIDLDINHKDGVSGIQNFTKLIEDLAGEDKNIINSTYAVATPRGGKHLYFKYVKGIKSKADYFKKMGLPGVDIRNDGGQVPIANSIRKIEGKAAEYKVINDGDIEEMPQGLINLFLNADSPIDKFQAFDEDIFLPLKGMVEGEGRNSALNEALFRHCNIHHIRDITTIRLLALAINNSYFGEPEEGFLSTADSVYRAINSSDEVEYSPISEYGNCYFKEIKKGSIAISNFTIRPIRFIECIDDTSNSVIDTIIITQKNEHIPKQYKASDFDNINNFDKATNDFRTRFTGSIQDLKFIKTLVFNQVEIKIKGVSCGGIHLIEKEWYFVDNVSCINAKGEVVENIVLLNTDRITSELSKYEPITTMELKDISKDLFKFNCPEITLGVMGYVSGIFLKEKLKKIGFKYSHLFYSGEPGAGKSETLEKIIIPMLGITNNVLSANGCTKFALEDMVSSNNTIPLIIDEFKPATIESFRIKLILNTMKCVYDQQTSLRGKQDLNIKHSDLVSPILLSGEASTDDNSVLERCLSLTFSKKESKIDGRTSSYNNIKNNKSLNKLGKSLLLKSLKLTLDEIQDLYIECEKMVSKSIKVDRVRHISVITLMGVCLMIDLFNDLGLDFEKETNIIKKDIPNIINNNIVNENLEGGTSTKSITDLTIEKINDIFPQGDRYFPDGGYSLCKIDGNILSIRFKQIYDGFTKYVKDYNVQGNWLQWKDFNKQLQKSDYYISHNVPVRFSKDDITGEGKVSKAYKIDIEKLKEKGIDIDNILDYSDIYR